MFHLPCLKCDHESFRGTGSIFRRPFQNRGPQKLTRCNSPLPFFKIRSAICLFINVTMSHSGALIMFFEDSFGIQVLTKSQDAISHFFKRNISSASAKYAQEPSRGIGHFFRGQFGNPVPRKPTLKNVTVFFLT